MDVLDGLKQIESESIDCIITSPPYWALRDYGIEGQIGQEKTFKEYIDKLCNVFDECKRILKEEGTCWVNIGDTYYSKSGGKFLDSTLSNKEKNLEMGVSQSNRLKEGKELKQKNLCNIPARFSIEMQDRGWILRNVIVWHKPNCIPSSIKDRFTVDFEYLFFFVKNKKYYFETQFEPIKKESLKRAEYGLYNNPNGQWAINVQTEKMGKRFVNTDGRIKRCVWSIPPKSYKESHFAVFPEELIRSPIKAGCPEYICKKCNKPRYIIFKPTKEYLKFLGKSWHDHKNDKLMGLGQQKRGFKVMKNISKIKKYNIKYSDCGCNVGFYFGTILDPFIGSGTTAVESFNQNKNCIGIEINQKYIPLIKKRLDFYLTQTKILDKKYNFEVIK